MLASRRFKGVVNARATNRLCVPSVKRVVG
jgi:hypothetical protein